MRTIIHAGAGATAMFIIASFWGATLIAELFLDHVAVAAVKQAIVYGLLLLVPCLAVTGGSGFVLGKRWPAALVRQKQRRMQLIAANGLLVLVPMALFLNGKAVAAEFDGLFYLVQGVELVAGMVQLMLMGLNFRDGLRLGR